MDPARARTLLAQRRARREQAEKLQLSIAMAATLREFYYPKQAEFFRRSGSLLKTTTKSRRAGVTTGGCHELIARALTLEGHRAEQGFRATIIHNTRIEARARAWRTDTKNGLVDILARWGKYIPGRNVDTYELGGETVEVRDGETALAFSNGSRIELMGADSEADLGKLRGVAKHVFWIDEAQDPRFVALLEGFYKGVIVPAKADFKAETWITGTPGKDLAGFFYAITREDEERLPGWDVSRLSVVDNPYFGDTPEERWAATALHALKENGWSEDDPDFQREWLAIWVKSDARFVYAAHQVAAHELTIANAPPRLDPTGFPDLVAALDDLPGRDEDPPRDYFLSMGCDLGTKDAFTIVVWAWSLADSVLYEVCSWRKPGLDYDEMAAYMHNARSQIHIGHVTADAAGGGKPAVMGWSKQWLTRYALPIVEADKQNKYDAIQHLNTDIRRGHIKVREGGELLKDWRVHRWAAVRSETGKLVEDKATHKSSDVADAGLYAHRMSFHHRHRPEELTIEPNSALYLEREESDLEDDTIAAADDFVGW